MPGAILRLLLPLLSLALLAAPAQSRVLHARIAQVRTAVATLRDVDVRLVWPDGATQGMLQLRAGQVIASDLGYRFTALDWRCPLQRDGRGGWRCDGDLRAGHSAPLRLTLALGSATTDASLSQGASTLHLQRSAATPDLTTLQLKQVPVAWAQSLATQAWAAGRFTAGTMTGRVDVQTPANRPLRVGANLDLRDVALQTPDASTAGDKLGAQLRIDYRKLPAATLLTVDGSLRSGELLAGNTYLALPSTPVDIAIDAMQRRGEGWTLPRFEWNDGAVLSAHGDASFDADANLQSLSADLRSANAAPLRDRYLSGWLALVGLSDVDMSGALDAQMRIDGGRLADATATLHGVDLRKPDGSFGFTGLDGDVRFSSGAPVDSRLSWRDATLYGLALGATQLPLHSADGRIGFDRAAIPLFGGTMTLDNATLRPPTGDAGLDIAFAMELRDIDVGQLSAAFDLPAFHGTLTGQIPHAHYADDVLTFDGGLSMGLFDGAVQVSSLSLERPFGPAPGLSVDIAFNDLDLLRLTEVLGFGSITGRLDGRIAGLRLVNWTPVAFDAQLRSDAQAAHAHGTRQRISQTAVQNISSVGDASFVTSLQGKLIGLFDDFGYAHLGIGCRLANEVCAMNGLNSAPGRSGSARAGSEQAGSEPTGFTILEGTGIPRLMVVGFNRNVDWPTLVERLVAVAKGNVKPVVE